MAFTNLFTPIKIGNTEIRNRIAMAPMGVGFYSPDESWPKSELRYFEERAMGGAGLIITPFVRIHDTLASIPGNGIYNDDLIPTHKEFADRVHKHGAKVICQLALHGGKLGSEGPSSVYSENYVVKPRALTTEEVDGLVESFIAAAGRAVKAGYDGVEVHGAHTYLIGAMMSPALNKRTDKYGGSFEGRMKFARDIITGIQKAYPGLTIGFKFSAFEALDGGIDIPLGIEIAKYIHSLGVSYLHVTSTSSTIEVFSKLPSVPPLYIPRNTLIPLARGVKKACPDAIVLATGSITVPEEAESFLAEGSCDMVVLGRTLLADPYWPTKAKEGRTKEITPCIRCNVCYHQLWLGEPLKCSLNPYLNRESEQELPIPAKKKTVMVVGAGPAGIRCALTAAKRGHDVTLYEKLPYIGGMVYPGSRPKCKEDVARAWQWFNDMLAASTVKVKLNTAVTPELVKKNAPDALVIAIGAEPVWPNWPGMDKPHVQHSTEVLRDVTKYKGKNAVVIGGGDVGCETACHLADHGWKVSIVEIQPRLMEENIMKNVKLQMFNLLEEKGVRVMTDTRVNAITDEGVEVILPDGKQGGIDADLVAVAIGFRKTVNKVAGAAMNLGAHEGLAATLSMHADEVHIIGDAITPTRIYEATQTGEWVGRNL